MHCTSIKYIQYDRTGAALKVIPVIRVSKPWKRWSPGQFQKKRYCTIHSASIRFQFKGEKSGILQRFRVYEKWDDVQRIIFFLFRINFFCLGFKPLSVHFTDAEDLVRHFHHQRTFCVIVGIACKQWGRGWIIPGAIAPLYGLGHRIKIEWQSYFLPLEYCHGEIRTVVYKCCKHLTKTINDWNSPAPDRV